MAKLRPTPAERAAELAEKAAMAAEAAKEAADINGAISEALDHWRKTVEARGVNADAHLLFRNAAIELNRLLKIDRTVQPPETHARTRQIVFDKLAEMADIGGIKPDDAQNILAGIFKEKSPEEEAAESEVRPEAPKPPQLQPLDLSAFFSLEIKPREMLLAPVVPQKGLVMLYASRGTGKTLIALGIAYAVATGTKFLKWTAPKPRRVLLIDGEMPAADLQTRLASMVAGATEAVASPGSLNILCGDLIEEGGIGNLAAPQVQAELEPSLEGIDLLILDNLSSLTAVIRDNDAESWGPIQEWLLRLRRRGISVLIVHHAGKGGQQRGTSRREDVLDTSISLRRPEDYAPTEGARFEVHIEKGRSVHGEDARPFEAKMEECAGTAIWTMREIADVNEARIKALMEDGLSVREIADETGIPKSTVGRIKKKIEAERAGASHD